MDITQKEIETAALLIERAAKRIEDYANRERPAYSGGGDRRMYDSFQIESADEYGILFICEYNGACYCHPEKDYEYITLPWSEITKD